MPDVAKIVRLVNGQAVLLPKGVLLTGDEVLVSQDKATGQVVLTPKATGHPSRKPLGEIDALFQLVEVAEVPESFLAERDQGRI